MLPLMTCFIVSFGLGLKSSGDFVRFRNKVTLEDLTSVCLRFGLGSVCFSNFLL